MGVEASNKLPGKYVEVKLSIEAREKIMLWVRSGV